jgi:hypothetical protein
MEAPVRRFGQGVVEAAAAAAFRDQALVSADDAERVVERVQAEPPTRLAPPGNAVWRHRGRRSQVIGSTAWPACRTWNSRWGPWSEFSPPESPTTSPFWTDWSFLTEIWLRKQ